MNIEYWMHANDQKNRHQLEKKHKNGRVLTERDV